MTLSVAGLKMALTLTTIGAALKPHDEEERLAVALAIAIGLAKRDKALSREQFIAAVSNAYDLAMPDALETLEKLIDG